jgi:predicted nucleotidyltransferase
MSIIKTRPQFNFDRIDPRTNEITPTLITAVVEEIVQRLQPAKVILFGSQANQRATPQSDLDLLIILDDAHPLAQLKPRARFGQLLELFRYRSFGLDAIVLTKGEVQTLRQANEGEWDLVLEILTDGKTVYDREQETETE